MSDFRLLVIATLFVAAVIILGGYFRNSIAQLLDTIVQGVRLVD